MALRCFCIFAIAALSACDAFTTVPPMNNLKVVSASSSMSLLQASAIADSPASAPVVQTVQQQQQPMAPLTVWGEEYDDIVAVQQKALQIPLADFGPEISAVTDLNLESSDTEGQLNYFRENRLTVLNQMQDHGCVVFRDFDLMKSQEGFQDFYAALGLQTCLDPLHSVSARPTVNGDKNSPVYEAVNKESRKNFFIGMHNEFVGTRAPRAAAFCCFKAAETGGEFLIADGRRIFRDLPSDLLNALYTRQIRYSVMELPFFGWIDTALPEFLKEPAASLMQGLVSTAINMKVDFSVEMQWGISEYDKVRMLQARAPRQPPVVAHPVTGDPTWFCNVHSHSSQLRQSREEIYGAERFEDGASQINKSDMFFGDDSEISPAQLKVLDEVTMKNVRFVKMREGDVVLLDNYKTLHGRNVFDGTRKHGVCWFQGWDGEQEQMEAAALKNKATA